MFPGQELRDIPIGLAVIAKRTPIDVALRFVKELITMIPIIPIRPDLMGLQLAQYSLFWLLPVLRRLACNDLLPAIWEFSMISLFFGVLAQLVRAPR